MRAVLYARKSTPDERNVAHQHVILRETCEREGWEVVAEFTDDGKSGWKPDAKRPGFDAAVSRTMQGDVDLFVITEVDRLTRINSHGLVALEYTNRVVIADSEGRRLRWSEVYDKVGKAREESDVKSRRQLRAIEREVDDGRPPRGGYRHFGYHSGNPDTCGCGDEVACIRHAVREDEADILREVAERWLAGEPMRALARDLQERGVPTVRGGAWSRTGLRKTLMSPRLAGIRVHRRGDDVRTVRLRDWTPVFSDELHGRLVAADSTSANRRAPERYLLTGLLRCGGCGSNLNGKLHAENRRRYTCLQCHRNGIGADPVDAAVWNAALGRSWHADRLDEAKLRERLTDLEAQLAADREQRLTLDDAWTDGKLTGERWARQVGRLDERIQKREAEAKRLRTDVRRATDGWSSLHDLATTGREARPAEQRDVIEAAVTRITLAPLGNRRGGRVDLSRLLVEWADGETTRGDELPPTRARATSA